MAFPTILRSLNSFNNSEEEAPMLSFQKQARTSREPITHENY